VGPRAGLDAEENNPRPPPGIEPFPLRTPMMQKKNVPETNSTWRRVLLENLIVTQLVKKFLTYYGSQDTDNESYSKPVKSGPQPHTLILRSFSILSSHLCLCLPNSFFLSGVQTKILYAFLTYVCVLHIPPIPFSLISCTIYCMQTNLQGVKFRNMN
jgi:hypothetical protein